MCEPPRPVPSPLRLAVRTTSIGERGRARRYQRGPRPIQPGKKVSFVTERSVKESRRSGGRPDYRAHGLSDDAPVGVIRGRALITPGLRSGVCPFLAEALSVS